MITVSRLRVAPVKGLATMELPELRLDVDGVAEDRRLFLLHADGSVVTMRTLPQLVGVRPELDLAERRLSVRLPDGGTATTGLDAADEPVTSALFGKRRTGRVLPGAVADALSELAGERLRLVLADRTGVGWDEGPVSLISQASAVAVGTPEDSDRIGAARYRMLIEIAGGEPYVEDGWVGRRIQVGEVTLRVDHPLVRCVVIHHHPETGRRDWAGLHTLAARRGRDRLTLGVIAEVEHPGILRVGDRVSVVEQAGEDPLAS